MANLIPMLDQLSGEIEAAAGAGVREQVMAGKESLKPGTDPAKIALWVQEAIIRLDQLTPLEVRTGIMERCGANCAKLHASVLTRAKARRKKFTTEEDFLAAELKSPARGTRLERQGNILYQIYTPQAFTRPVRCYCGLLRDLPQGETVSATYCNCSKAFTKAVWEAALGRPVQVEILESAVTGSSVCRFRIDLGEFS